MKSFNKSASVTVNSMLMVGLLTAYLSVNVVVLVMAVVDGGDNGGGVGLVIDDQHGGGGCCCRCGQGLPPFRTSLTTPLRTGSRNTSVSTARQRGWKSTLSGS